MSCKKCGEKFTDLLYCKWCKSCQIDDLKKNFTNWTSGNEKIDGFIQEMQLKIYSPWDVIFEWIPYNQFSNIKEIGGGDFASAIWKNGPLSYDEDNAKHINKSPDEKVTLGYLYNSQNISNEFLNEV